MSGTVTSHLPPYGYCPPLPPCSGHYIMPELYPSLFPLLCLQNPPFSTHDTMSWVSHLGHLQAASVVMPQVPLWGFKATFPVSIRWLGLLSTARRFSGTSPHPRHGSRASSSSTTRDGDLPALSSSSNQQRLWLRRSRIEAQNTNSSARGSRPSLLPPTCPPPIPFFSSRSPLCYG